MKNLEPKQSFAVGGMNTFFPFLFLLCTKSMQIQTELELDCYCNIQNWILELVHSWTPKSEKFCFN